MVDNKQSNGTAFKVVVICGISLSILIGIINMVAISSLASQLDENLKSIAATYDQNTKIINENQQDTITKLDRVIDYVSRTR